ncbi:hypothetical protein QBD01_000711 [Ochrobactrum sp. 19YEA23]|uniref:hypothetical protein n=1 Tax=Ochrobactrum sp. 19YEA23 TaxID=3039854 RepID=UPI00247846A9|nr:hypothetical protein [Ochrobactrum sp. 19YEA23]
MRKFDLALQLQIRQAVAKRVTFEHRSGAYFWVREHRSTGNCSLQPGITKNATAVLGENGIMRRKIPLKRWRTIQFF